MTFKNRKDEARTEAERYVLAYYFSLGKEKIISRDISDERNSNYRYARSVISQLEDRFIDEKCPELTAGLAAVITEVYRFPEITAQSIQDVITKVATYFKRESVNQEYQKALSHLWNNFMPEQTVGQK